MKQTKLTSFLAVTISFELLVGPLIPIAYATESTTTPAPTPHVRETKRQGPGAAEYINFGLQTAGKVLSQVQGGGGGQSPQFATDMYHLQQQQTPQPDKYFSAQKLSMIPGLGKYLAINNINPAMLNCNTLPTTMHDMKPEVCRLGVTGDKGDPNMQLSEAYTYYNQYLQTQKIYENFSASSNSDGQPFGIGCMNNAMQILNGFFKYRTDELNKLVTNLEAMNNQFKEASRADLDAIKESIAVLEGGDTALASEVRSKRPDLFDFQKRFNNPACASIEGMDDINQNVEGASKRPGLNNIATFLKSSLNDKAGGQYSGANYAASHAAVVKDINTMADQFGKQFELNFNKVWQGGADNYLQNMSGVILGTSSTTGVKILPSTLLETQSKFLDGSKKLYESISDVSQTSGNALQYLGQTSSKNFEAEVAKLENDIKNKCLASNVDSATFISKIYDPSSSQFANDNTSNFLKEKLDKILGDTQISIERKVAELKAVEAQQGNRYIVRMNNAYEVQELDENGNLVSRIVEASNRKSPSSYLEDLVKNCNAQFKANKLGSGNLTGAETVQRLRQINQEHKRLAASQAIEAKNEIRKKLIECSSPEVANNSIAGSCSSARFIPSAEGFCANAAFSCSKNMQACSKQAETFVKEIKTQKTARTNNYKTLLEKNKNDIVRMFDVTLSQYMKEGETLRGIFGAGFESPIGIERQVPEGGKYLMDVMSATGQGVDGALLLENPDAFVEMFKKNIELLKDKVAQQQDQILGGKSVGEKSSGLLANHIEATRKNYEAVRKSAERSANECLAQHDKQLNNMEQARAAAAEQAQKMQSELGEKLPVFCRKFGTGSNPSTPSCNGNVDELGKAAMQAAQASYNRVGDTEIVADWIDFCNGASSYNESSSSVDWDAECLKKDGVFIGELLKARPGLKGLCEGYLHAQTCISTPATTHEKAIICPSVQEKRQDLDASYVRGQNVSKHSNSSASWSQPTFCNAGNDGNRSSGKAIMGGIDQLMQSLSTGATRN